MIKYLSFGRSEIFCKFTEQKLNTKSSTEAESVGANDCIPNTIWAKNFLGAQGYKVEEKIFEQDNKSTIKLVKNGRLSAGPNSWYIIIIYF